MSKLDNDNIRNPHEQYNEKELNEAIDQSVSLILHYLSVDVDSSKLRSKIFNAIIESLN